MANETLEINLNRETNFDFELSITGISANDAKVRFGIDLPGFTVQIPCTRGDDKIWSVTVPALESVAEEGHYGFSIELIVNGYHFSPVKGTAKLAPVAEVTGSVPRKSVEVAVTSITPKKDVVKPAEEKKAEKVVKAAEKKEEKKEKKAPKKKSKKKKEEEVEEVSEESIVDHMINKRFEPFEKGKSILSQMVDGDVEEVEPLSDQEKAVKDILKDI